MYAPLDLRFAGIVFFGLRCGWKLLNLGQINIEKIADPLLRIWIAQYAVLSRANLPVQKVEPDIEINLVLLFANAAVRKLRTCAVKQPVSGVLTTCKNTVQIFGPSTGVVIHQNQEIQQFVTRVDAFK